MVNVKPKHRNTPQFHPAPNPVTACEQIAPNLYRIKRGTGYQVEVEATEDQLHQWTGVPLDVELPWSECELCGTRFLDWDGGGLCSHCEKRAAEHEYEPEWLKEA